jgi:hypothetical protein
VAATRSVNSVTTPTLETNAQASTVELFDDSRGLRKAPQPYTKSIPSYRHHQDVLRDTRYLARHICIGIISQISAGVLLYGSASPIPFHFFHSLKHHTDMVMNSALDSTRLMC